MNNTQFEPNEKSSPISIEKQSQNTTSWSKPSKNAQISYERRYLRCLVASVLVNIACAWKETLHKHFLSMMELNKLNIGIEIFEVDNRSLESP